MASCDICGEEFSRPDSLSRHLKRKYPCNGKKYIVENLNSNEAQANCPSTTIKKTTIDRVVKTVGIKRKHHPTSLIDSIINGSIKESSTVPPQKRIYLNELNTSTPRVLELSCIKDDIGTYLGY